jgi:hypothetical protein
MTDLIALLDQVANRESFLDFVKALAADRAGEVAKERENPSNPWSSGANGWQNGTIETFLDAAIAWAVDSQRLPDEPSWRAFATFLYCGKIYE